MLALHKKQYKFSRHNNFLQLNYQYYSRKNNQVLPYTEEISKVTTFFEAIITLGSTFICE